MCCSQSPLDPERATLVTHAVAEAVAALHAAGIVHGNIHPGTILIADDGRVVLLDAHADAPSDSEYDVRAVGAVLYACLTGHWPYAEAGRSALPDAVRDGHGRLARPRQVRGGIPRHLDEIATELLEPQVEPPPAAALAAEFARSPPRATPTMTAAAGTTTTKTTVTAAGRWASAQTGAAVGAAPAASSPSASRC